MGLLYIAGGVAMRAEGVATGSDQSEWQAGAGLRSLGVVITDPAEVRLWLLGAWLDFWEALLGGCVCMGEKSNGQYHRQGKQENAWGREARKEYLGKLWPSC